MYMEAKVYSVNEFRNNLREALNYAEAGGEVIVVRHNHPFKLMKATVVAS